MFQHLGLLQATALQLDMLKGHFAWETQDHRQTEGLERMDKLATSETVYIFMSKVLIPYEFCLKTTITKVI